MVTFPPEMTVVHPHSTFLPPLIYQHLHRSLEFIVMHVKRALSYARWIAIFGVLMPTFGKKQNSFIINC